MDSGDEKPAAELVRRVLAGGRLREFLHPVDGGPARERELGRLAVGLRSLTVGPPEEPCGQLFWQEVSDEIAALPLQLPRLRASCDGSGACCGMHHHMPVTREEREGIMTLLASSWEAPAPLELLIHEAYENGTDDSFNIALVNGSCAFHRPDGLCELHLQGGPLAKPMACRSFPSQLVLCGDRWYCSLRPECSCLQRTAVEGAELGHEQLAWTSLQGFHRYVLSVPDQVRITADRSLSRNDYLLWLHGTIDRLARSFEPIAELRCAAAQLDLGSPAPDPGVQRPPGEWLQALVDVLAERLSWMGDSWADGSVYEVGLRWALQCARAVAADSHLLEPQWSAGRRRDWARRQASLLSMVLHGHGLLEVAELGRAVTDLGHLAWLARASNAVVAAEQLDPRLESMTLWLFFWRSLELHRL